MNIETYRDCARNAAIFLKLDEAKKTLENGAENSADESVKKEIEDLVECVNLTLHEIACDYIPLKKTQSFYTDDNRIYFKDFCKNPIDIFAVKHKGRTVDFKTFHDCILTGCEGKYDITYSYAPLCGGLETILEWDGAYVNSRIVGYGAACEYCLINGMADEAMLWDKRFKDALFKRQSVKSERKIRQRQWYL